MTETGLGTMESRFADIIWKNEPIASGELARLCQDELGWKRTTAYTVLKKLCVRGIFKNEGGIVSSLIGRSDFYAQRGKFLVDEAFDGSLPAFLAAFTSSRRLSQRDIDEIRRMIAEAEEKK